MPYFVYVEQKNDGCDYTIGCGYRLHELKGATNLEQAYVAFEQLCRQHGYLDDTSERTISKATLLECVHSVGLNIDDLQRRYYASRDAEAWKLREDAERAEYERLKAKYG